MKRGILGFFCFFLALIFILAMARRDDSKPISYFKDKNTFIIIAKGKPVEGETDKLKREYQAERAAVTVAQFEISIKLKGFKVAEQTITHKKFDRNQTCTLTYLVRIVKE